MHSEWRHLRIVLAALLAAGPLAAQSPPAPISAPPRFESAVWRW